MENLEFQIKSKKYVPENIPYEKSALDQVILSNL